MTDSSVTELVNLFMAGLQGEASQPLLDRFLCRPSTDSVLIFVASPPFAVLRLGGSVLGWQRTQKEELTTLPNSCKICDHFLFRYKEQHLMLVIITLLQYIYFLFYCPIRVFYCPHYDRELCRARILEITSGGCMHCNIVIVYASSCQKNTDQLEQVSSHYVFASFSLN